MTRCIPGQGIIPQRSSMTIFQQRVMDEKAKLDLRIRRLSQLIRSPRFTSQPEDEQARIRKQYGIMVQYSAILKARIFHFVA